MNKKSYKLVFNNSNRADEIRALNKIKYISDFNFKEIKNSTYEIDIYKITVLDLLRYILKEDINIDVSDIKIFDIEAKK